VCPDIFLKKIIKNYNSKSIQSYGSLDKKYQKIIKKLDYSQLRALSYATKTLPDMFNLRIDKAFMKNSVEARLPYQAIKLVEFFIAMPKIYRFGKNNNSFGKYFSSGSSKESFPSSSNIIIPFITKVFEMDPVLKDVFAVICSFVFRSASP